MTRKDYILIAEALRITYLQHKPILSQALNGVGDAANEIADALKRDNPRFDKEHFLAVVRGEKDVNSRPRSCARIVLRGAA